MLISPTSLMMEDHPATIYWARRLEEEEGLDKALL